MINTTEKSIEFKGAHIAYYTKGVNKDNAILFLHPAFGDSNIFSEQVDYFSKDGYVIFVDMIGHGNSQQNKITTNMGDMPQIVSEILKAERIAKAHITGVSLGSLIAQGFAHNYPDMTKSVTIVGGYSIHKDNKDIIKAQGQNIFKWLFMIIFSMKSFRKHVTKTSSYSDACFTAMENGAEKFTRKSFAAMQQDKIFIDKSEPMKYPMLIVVGEHDLELAVTAAKRLNKLEPNSTLKVIENAGHCANIDNPVVFNDVLGEFIEHLH